ncbi:hypothetical protein NPD9_708 [Clostridium botulinum]|nr:hypothetical protein NPD9_708 [Clostridium botulinum]
MKGSERCYNCFEVRLNRSAEYAKSKKFDYFTTTLTISPLKNATKINEIGLELEKNIILNFSILILRKIMVINILWIYQKNIIYIVKITVVVFFHSKNTLIG